MQHGQLTALPEEIYPIAAPILPLCWLLHIIIWRLTCLAVCHDAPIEAMQHALHNVPGFTEDLSLSVACPAGEAMHLVKREVNGTPILHHASHCLDVQDLLVRAYAEASQIQDRAGSEYTWNASSSSGWGWTVYACRDGNSCTQR